MSCNCRNCRANSAVAAAPKNDEDFMKPYLEAYEANLINMLKAKAIEIVKQTTAGVPVSQLPQSFEMDLSGVFVQTRKCACGKCSQT